MKLISFSVLAFALSLASLSLQAQTDDGLKHCGQTQAIQSLHAKHPELQQHEAQLKQNKSNTGTANKAATATYIIPIVFHIVHEYGYENISDAQVIDAVRILNEDYQLRNADTSTIVPSFKNLKANLNIEFRLAKLDPNGNCTNGIIHVVSPLTNVGDDNVKSDQWDPSKYLNVWVVKSMMAGAAGYAYYPSTADGWPAIDGVVILQDYIGSIGTGAYFRGRALTHEIGHYLDLEHTWGDTNQPGVACGDDGVADTPDTQGWTSCNLSGSICNPPIIENVQNYMEYAYCSRMFTLDQKTRMINALTSTIANRSNLWSPSNLLSTGTDNASFSSTLTCKPIADFTASSKFACVGSSITFSDVSYNAPTSSWQWLFTGGTPSVSTTQTQVVVYNTPGTYPVKLKVANSQGNDSITKTSYITIQPAASPGASTISESFETITIPNTNWTVNSGTDSYTWQMATVGATGSKSVKLNTKQATDGDVDELVGPSLNLNSSYNAYLTFKVAFAQTNTSNTDKFRVLSSKNCGQTWDQRYIKNSTALATTTTIVTGNFVPTAAQWRTETVTLPTILISSNTMFKFEFTSGSGNTIYIDDINVTSAASTNDLLLDGSSVQVMPNPFENQASIKLNARQDGKLTIELVDVLGKSVYTSTDNPVSAGDNTYTIQKNNLTEGVYFLNMTFGETRITRKVIIQ
ncbi:MAG: T9SS type A sorting domain-containing protein [Bacteroidetes bacterium]|nr:T9SS type A sorting domain-containing protein [Bacteroidota bacterium]